MKTTNFDWSSLDRVRTTPETLRRAKNIPDTARAPRRTWSPVLAVACVAVILLGVGILWMGRNTTPPPVAPDGGTVLTTINTNATTMTTTTIASPTVPITRPSAPLEGVGGFNWKGGLWHMAGSHGAEFIIDRLTADGLVPKEYYKEEWCSQFEFYSEIFSDPNLVNGTRTDAEFTVYHYVKEYDISREYVEQSVLKVYESTKEFDPDDPLIVYTKEEIDAIFAPTPTEFIRLFANPCTIIVNDVIYTPIWLEEHTLEEWTEVGITKEAIESKLDTWHEYFLYPSEKDTILKEKVDTFCG